jgi:pyruvate,water dikinase
VAVRSSAVDEDGQTDSFAGQHETYLNLTDVEEIKDAVERCWASAYSERASAYRNERGLATDVKLAVLVQQLVPADVSAVVFTSNPATGSEEEVVVNASWGLGESIVGGTVTPDTVIFRKFDLQLVSQKTGEKKTMTVRRPKGVAEVKVPTFMRSSAAASNLQALEMAGFAVKLEEQMGWPVDVEFAYQGDLLYLLQCRPITTDPGPEQKELALLELSPDFPMKWDDPADQTLHWSFDPMHSPHPLKPLESDCGVFVNEGITRANEYYGGSGKMRSRVVNGYQYHTFQSASSPRFMAMQKKRVKENVKKAALQLDELWRYHWLPEIQQLLSAWDDFDLADATVPDLLSHLDDTFRIGCDLWYLHFRIVRPTYTAIDLFVELYKELFETEGDFDALKLLQGLNNKTLETGHRLWDISQQFGGTEIGKTIRSTPTREVLEVLKRTPQAGEFLEALHEYLEEYGQRSDLWDHSSPTWIEDPTPVIINLKEYIDQPEHNPRAELAAMAAARDEAVDSARSRLRDYPKDVAKTFETLLRAAQIGVILSEDHGYWIDARGSFRIRRVFMEFGHRFSGAGLIEESNDVFYLNLGELRTAAAALPDGDLHQLVEKRKTELARFATLTPPAAIGAEEESPDESSFTGKKHDSTGDPSVLRGNAGSPGKVQGVARIVRSTGDAEKLNAGEILVAVTTAPSWTPLFNTAAAVVTDTGGILSHCAVVAREYAIPAVVGVADATRIISDGQLIEVDGESGMVRLLHD